MTSIFNFGKGVISGEGLDEAIADFWTMEEQLGRTTLLSSLGVSNVFDAMAKWCRIRGLNVES